MDTCASLAHPERKHLVPASQQSPPPPKLVELAPGLILMAGATAHTSRNRNQLSIWMTFWLMYLCQSLHLSTHLFHICHSGNAV